MTIIGGPALHLRLVTFVHVPFSPHSPPQSPWSFWPVVGIESSRLVQNRKSAIHGLPVKSSKSDWLRMRNEYSAHTQKIGSGQTSRFQPQARRIVGSGDENVFATASFNFGLPTYFVSHYCYRRALHAVFYRRVFEKKVEQSCLTVVWQMTCQRSRICLCASCWHHSFVLLVQFAMLHLKI